MKRANLRRKPSYTISKSSQAPVKHWEIIADKLSKAGWRLGWVSAIDLDDPGGGNKGYYPIGRKPDIFVNVTGGWSRVIPIAGWFGNDSQGGGIASFDINGDGQMDLIVFHMDNPEDDNRGYYRVIFSPLLA